MKWDYVFLVVALPIYCFVAYEFSGWRFLIGILCASLATIGSRYVGYMEGRDR